MIKLAIVGVGKIVRDQHLPSIQNTGIFELVATASRNAQLEGVAAYTDIAAMFAEQNAIQAVALCMPPQYRFAAACAAIDHGCHVLLEKPPGASVNEVNHLVSRAAANGVSLYASWHSRHAPAVARAKQLLSQARVNAAKLTWVEDVRKWHPGQDWIWQAGGLGVFDPGINGLSILTEVLRDDLRVRQSKLLFPANRQAPIAANLQLSGASGLNVSVELDWRVSQDSDNAECWELVFETDIGVISLLDGGSRCLLNNEIAFEDANVSPYVEYESIYRDFAKLIQHQQSSVDVVPLQLVADSFMLAETSIVAAFDE